MFGKDMLKLLFYMITSIIIFVLGYDFLCGYGLLLQNNYNKYNIIINDCNHINEKTQIYYRGVPVGRITKIELSDDNKNVKLTFYIVKKIEVSPNSTIIIRDDILGNKTLSLEICDTEINDGKIAEEYTTLRHKYIKSDVNILVDHLRNMITELSSSQTQDSNIITKISEVIDSFKILLNKTEEKINDISVYLKGFVEKNNNKTLFGITL